jgi:MFS family permease
MEARMAPVSMLPVPVRAQQRWTLLAVCLAALALPLSFSAGAVAVPALARSAAASPTALAWVTNAFMLTFGSLLLAAGGLADRYGRRRLFLLGTAGFTTATAVVCLAPTLLWLDLARGLQGVAAAAALASGTAAAGAGLAGAGACPCLRPAGHHVRQGWRWGLLAGLLLQALGWRSVFAAGGVLTLVAFGRARALPESHGERGHWISAACWLQPDAGGVDPGPAVAGRVRPACLRVQLALLATLLLGVFVCIERLHRSPLLDLSLFSQPAFLGVQLLPVATCFGYVVLLVLPLQLLGVHGQSATLVGLQMLALSAPMLVLPMLAARWAERVGSARLCTLGLLVCATGLYLLSRQASHPSPSQWVPLLMLVGAGTALPGLMDGLSVSVVPVQRAGMAAGIFGTVRVAGEGIALAAVTALLALLIGHQRARRRHRWRAPVPIWPRGRMHRRRHCFRR